MLCPQAEHRLLGIDDTNDVGCHTESVHQPSSQQQAASCLAFGFDASNAAGECAAGGPAEPANKQLPPGPQSDPGEISDGIAVVACAQGLTPLSSAPVVAARISIRGYVGSSRWRVRPEVRPRTPGTRR
jgi:hypothetical protein